MGRNTFFITGGTGFLGSCLITEILKNHFFCKIYCLARSTGDANAKERIMKTIAPWLTESELLGAEEQLEVFEGDITKKNLGLDNKQIECLEDNVTHLFHCAADVIFGSTLAEARCCNVNGTRNLLEFAKNYLVSKKLRRFCHFSTAYVAGDKKGVISENEISLEQGFLNSYEQSKAEAEVMLYAYRGEIPITVLRPSIIVGHSVTGYTKNFNVLYFPLRLLCKGFFPFSPNGYLDCVTVDYVAKAGLKISLDEIGCNKTFHLVGGKEHLTDWSAFAMLVLEKASVLRTESEPLQHLVLDHHEYLKEYKLRYQKYNKHVAKAMELIQSNYVPYIVSNEKYFDDSNTRSIIGETRMGIKPVMMCLDVLAEYCVRTVFLNEYANII